MLQNHVRHIFIHNTRVFLSFSLHLSPRLSLRSDINCLLPNLIRNFRRRDNLTSFLFSLARTEPLVQGSRSQDFSIHERVSERASERAMEGRARPTNTRERRKGRANCAGHRYVRAVSGDSRGKGRVLRRSRVRFSRGSFDMYRI